MLVRPHLCPKGWEPVRDREGLQKAGSQVSLVRPEPGFPFVSRTLRKKVNPMKKNGHPQEDQDKDDQDPEDLIEEEGSNASGRIPCLTVQEAADASENLHWGKGFHHVVVGPQVEAPGDVLFPSHGREHHDGKLIVEKVPSGASPGVRTRPCRASSHPGLPDRCGWHRAPSRAWAAIRVMEDLESLLFQPVLEHRCRKEVVLSETDRPLGGCVSERVFPPASMASSRSELAARRHRRSSSRTGFPRPRRRR